MRRCIAVLVWVLVAVSCRSAAPVAGPDTVAVATPTVPAETSTSIPIPTPLGTATTEPATTEPDEAVSAAPRNQLAAGDHTIVLNHGRRERSYIVHVPPRTTGPLPVVVALHGGGGTGAQFQEENGLDEVADREGFLAVYPEGTGVLPDRLHTWNSGDNCCGFALDRDIDDTGFLEAVLTGLPDRVWVDPARVYMTGHSNGAMMAYRFAAEHADLVTAIVPVGGGMDLEEFAPSAPVPVLHIHSLDDPRSLYGGGEGPPFPGTERTIMHKGVLPGIEAWANANGCGIEVTTETVAVGSGENAGQSADLLAWGGCPSGANVEHLRLTGTGHGWPGVAVGPVWQSLLGPPTTLIDASETVWTFVSRFER